MSKIIVVVEEVEVARTALQWALDNILRCGDVLTLLHVYPTTNNNNKKSKKKHIRRLRLKGFQLALSFRDICHAFPNTKTEIVVTEGDQQDGRRIAAIATEIGASTLVLGLHDRSFLYGLITPQNNSSRNLNCKVLAIKEPTLTSTRSIPIHESLTNIHFSQIEISMLSVFEVAARKIPYRICPDPSAILWRSRPSGTRRSS